MIPKFYAKLLSVVFTVISMNVVSSQERNSLDSNLKTVDKNEESIIRQFTFLELRGSNAFEASAGSAIINGDYPDPEFEVYFRVGYKYHLNNYLNVNFTYNKYNIAFKELFNEGYMSFDLNLELLLLPYKKFTPYIYAGGGYNASNSFENTATKAQAGLGFEVLVANGVGLKLFGEYNYMFTDELDGRIAGESDDTIMRMGLGVNIYFGGNKKKEALSKKMKTVFNSNRILDANTSTTTDN